MKYNQVPVKCRECGSEMDELSSVLLICQKCGNAIPMFFGFYRMKPHYEVFDTEELLKRLIDKNDNSDF